MTKEVNKMKIGDVRIVKVDDLNYCVQRCKEIDGKDKTGVSTKRLDWVDAGYYGDKIEWAARAALMAKVPEGKALLGEFKKAVQDIIVQVKA